MTKTDSLTLSLLTNDEVLAVNQYSKNNRQLFRTEDGLIAWIADVPNSKDKYLALFNTQSKGGTDLPKTANVKVNFDAMGIKGKAKVRDLWSHKDLGTFNGSFSREILQHGAGLYRITPLR